MNDAIKAEMIALLPRLRRFALGLARDPDEADDIVQSACVRALTSLDQWQEGTRLDSWMYRIVQTTFIDRSRRRKTRGDEIDVEAARDLAGSDGERDIEARLTLKAVRRAIGELPDEQRAALMLVSVEGLSYRDAAETLEIPQGTLMSRLSRARLRLADMMKRDEFGSKTASAAPGARGQES